MSPVSNKKRYASLLALVTIAVVMSDWTIRAQAPALLPSVDLRRDARLSADVWPADFNGDGLTDLVASQAGVAGSPTAVQVVLGSGNGTFGTPIVTNVAGHVIGVADFNGDRRVDVIVSGNPPSVGVSILPGNGNGTFGTARAVTSDFGAFAITGDFNGDTRRDLVFGGETEIRVYPGNGDFTFGTPVRFPHDDIGTSTDCLLSLQGVQPCGGGVPGDFDNDGDLDFVTTSGVETIQLFTNGGALLFSARSISLEFQPTDVTARDLDGDDALDLLVSIAAPENGMYFNGFVDVLKGNGDGTFEPAVRYATGPGPFQVVVGDFTHDGQIDIATANRSYVIWPNCGPFFQGSDSVSILPGNNGSFGPPTTFALADQSVPVTLEASPLRNGVFSLNTSDLDRDRFPDLIVSQGVWLLTRAPAANRPPVANAGPDVEIENSSFFELIGTATDPDKHLLDFVWTGPEGTAGSVFHPSRVCFEGLAVGSSTFTLTVDDGHGGVDEDSVVYTRTDTTVPPEVQVLNPTAGEVVPAGVPYTIRWTASDDTGIARFDLSAFIDQGPNGRTVVITECQNLPPDATECTWQNPPPTEAAQVIVQATDVDGNTGGGASGQFFIRSSGPGSLPTGWTNRDIGAVGAAGSAAFASGVFTVRGSGSDIWDNADELHYAYRTMAGNTEITARVDSVQNINRWVKAGLMVRESTNANARHVSLFATPTTEKGVAFQRRTTTGGSSIHSPGPASAPPLWLRVTRVGDIFRAYYRKNIVDAWVLVGEQSMPGFPATALYGLAVSSHVDGQLAQAAFSNVFVAALPAWSATSINAIGGTLSFDYTRFTVGASGVDIWNTSDEFVFLHTPFAPASRQTITARVLSLTDTHRWAKAGVMIRETVNPQSPHVMVIVSPSRGIAMQWRSVESGESLSTTPRAGRAPAWVRLTRSGNTYTGYTSNDGVNWVTLGTVTIAMQPDFAGLAVTSHIRPVQATGVFDDVRVQ